VLACDMVVVLVALVLLLLPAQPAQAKSHPLTTAVVAYDTFLSNDRDVAFRRVRAAGATVVRLPVYWSTVAPDASVKPAGLDASNPADPAYRWHVIDAMVKGAVRAGLRPILLVWYAPSWAERGSEGPAGGRDPDPAEFASFAQAAARRYSGSFGDLPRVRYWQAWSEPNVWRDLTPQFDTPLSRPVLPSSRPVSPGLYRRLVNGFATAVKSVHASNLVIAGGQSPFGRDYADSPAVAPLRFMRALLCMTARNRPQPGCTSRVRFDIWSHHPYTEGGPSHHAELPDNVSLGDLPEMRRLLLAAARAGHIVSPRRPRFWVTEFSWDTNPPDPRAVPVALHARWTAEALYRMWRQGVSLTTWFLLRDDTLSGPHPSVYESGLYFRCARGIGCDRPKPALRAFRFPLVAFRSGKRVRVWGRTPGGQRRRVIVEQRRGRGWRRLTRLRANRYGIFVAKPRSRSRGAVRARLTGRNRDRSLPFALGPTPDIHVHPFG
jgi:hypothetical protein